jgi:hypothetical protein
MLSMLKRGEAKVPFEKVPALAQALDLDPAHVFRLAVEQYWPDDAKVINKIFGAIKTRNEAAIIARIRDLSGQSDPPLTADLDAKLTAAFS